MRTREGMKGRDGEGPHCAVRSHGCGTRQYLAQAPPTHSQFVAFSPAGHPPDYAV